MRTLQCAQVLLALDGGVLNIDITKVLGIDRTRWRIRKRYVEQGLGRALVDQARLDIMMCSTSTRSLTQQPLNTHLQTLSKAELNDQLKLKPISIEKLQYRQSLQFWLFGFVILSSIIFAKVSAMSETQPLTVDFTQEDEVLQILPQPSLRSSANLGWNGIYVQQHQQPAWETPEYAHTRHMLLIHNPNLTIQAERWFDGRKQQEQFGGGNNIVVVPAGVLHQANWNQENSFSLLFLEPNHLVQVACESLTKERVQLTAHSAIHDSLIDQIGRSLAAELETNQLHSRLFVDSLTIALSIHLLRHYSDWQQPLREDLNGLPQRKLKQAIEYINEHLVEDLQ